MANDARRDFLGHLKDGFALSKLAHSNSLFELADYGVRIYVRYSKLHDEKKTFYGIRRDDLSHLRGKPSFLVFLWEDQDHPLFVPFADLAGLFDTAEPSSDGQFKVQLLISPESVSMYVPQMGHTPLQGINGWKAFDTHIKSRQVR